MDNKILQFPSSEVREWSKLEAELRVLFRSYNASDELIERVCHEMKLIFMEHNKNLALPGTTPPEVIYSIRRYIFDMFMGLFQEILVLQIRLYNLGDR